MSSKLGEAQDRHATDACQAALDRTSRILKKTREMLVEWNAMPGELNENIDRLMEHLGVPPKPPAGFVKE